MERIPLYKLQTDYRSAIYNSGRWIDGSCMRTLEERLEEYLGVRHVVLTNSGTSSLLAAYWVLRERFPCVQVCPYTWPATYQTAKILNLEINFRRAVLAEHFGFDRESLEVIVHLFGQPSPLLALAEPQRLLEDAAQAFGAEYNGKKVGTFGLVGCYSFYPTKNLHSCGHGGAISTDDFEIYKALKLFVECGRWEGRVTQTLALNLRLDEVKAEFLLWELGRYEERIAIQREIAQRYLSLIPGTQPFLEEPPGGRHVYSVFNLLVDERDRFREFMAERAIDTMIYYDQEILPLEERSKYGDITSRVAAIPCRWNITGDEVERVCAALSEWFS